MKKSIIILSIATLITIYGCEKETKPTQTNLSKTELLCNGNWIMKQLLINGKDTTKAWFNTCELDDIFIYKRNGKLWIDYGALKCDPIVPQIDSSSTWRFIDNETRIMENDESWKIEHLSEKKFDISIVSPEGDHFILKMIKK